MQYIFVIVGVGGTGSLLARDLPKLMIGTINKMLVIDGDDVETKNMVRQSYQQHDIGENKANALSKKINTFYGNVCESMDSYITKNELVIKLKTSYKEMTPVIIGCVDNDKTRKILESTFKKLSSCIYIDSANSEYEGNVYVAVKQNKKIAGNLRGNTYKLADDVHPLEKSCQELASAGNTQYLVTNLKMATAIFEHVSNILSGTIKVGVTNVKRFEAVHYGV